MQRIAHRQHLRHISGQFYFVILNVIEVVGNGENNLILDGEGKEDAAASRRVEVRYVLKTE